MTAWLAAVAVALVAIGMVVVPRVRGQGLADRSGVDVGAPSPTREATANEPVVISRDIAPEFLWDVENGGSYGRLVATDADRAVSVTAEMAVLVRSSRSGALRFYRKLPAFFATALVIVDDTILVETRPNGLLALDAADGTERWRDGGVGSDPPRLEVVVDGMVVRGTKDGVRMLDLVTGESVEGEVPPPSEPAEVLPGLTVTTVGSRLTIAPPGAARRVDVDLDSEITGSAALDERTVVVATRDGRMLAVRVPDPADWPGT